MTTTVLLDLGNVVLGIDFHNVFNRWSELADVPVTHFHERWTLDEPYKAHEIGALSFAGYCANLRRMFELELSDAEWRDGWNELWTQPFDTVVALLPELAARYRLCAFSNTNDTHADCWRNRYVSELTAFEHVFVSSEIGLRKPDAAAFAHVCEAMQAQPASVLFVDDTKENVDGAQRSGLRTRHVTSEQHVREILEALL